MQSNAKPYPPFVKSVAAGGLARNANRPPPSVD